VKVPVLGLKMTSVPVGSLLGPTTFRGILVSPCSKRIRCSRASRGQA
jgi:hypothetical protein